MGIEFDSAVDTARFKSPLEGFEPVEKEIEHREDPLTDRTVRIVPDVFPPSEGAEAVPEGVVGDGSECFFCPHSVAESTPEYPAFVGTDRGSRGEATSFPNLFPYLEHSNVVVLTEAHFRPMDEIGADRLADGIACALEYLGAVAEAEAPRFASINMNFLPSSGSSVAHPHVQALADDHGTDRQAAIARGEAAYRDAEGGDYWADLLDRERGGDRYVGETGAVEWLAPFAPLGQFHVAGIADRTGLLDPEDGAVADFAEGIDRVLDYYAESGLNAFNFGLRFDRESPAPPVVDVVARPAFEPNYVNDAFYLQAIHRQAAVDEPPEAYAPEIAAHF